MARFDAVVIGGGPAGLSAASLLATQGARTVLLDEQAAPGGQIYRAIEGASPALRTLLGEDYTCGAWLVDRLRASGAEWRPGSAVWQVTPDREVWVSREGSSELLRADVVMVATGAIERPVPGPGWTLPGAMTCGAVQILLKTSGLVAEGAVLAGSGPLLYLVAAQCIAVGVNAGLVVVLAEQDLANAVAGERALGVCVESLLVFSESASQVAFGDQLLALEDGDAHLQVRCGLEHHIVGVNADATGAAKGIHDVLRISADDFDLLVFGLAVGFNAQVDGHAEEVEVLLNLADGPEALVVAEAIVGVLVSKFGRAGTVDPLGKERG